MIAAALITGCGGFTDSHGRKSLRLEGVDRCEYDVRIVSERPLLLDVDVSCRGIGARGLEAADARVADAVEAPRHENGPLSREGSSFRLLAPRAKVSLHYRVNLEQLARADDLDLALRSGRSLMAPVSSFLLYPVPLDVGIEVELRVEPRPGFDFVAGLARSPSGYTLQGHEIPVATYAAFGANVRKEVPISVGPAVIDLAVLDGKLAVAPEALASWIQRRANAVADFFGSFPAPRTLVVVVPVVGDDDVVFGKLLPESAPGVLLLVGSEAQTTSLSLDWVLVHELFHIGVPSFHEEGKWFDEGLATYFEPILRVRAGLLDEAALWREFAKQMPKGVRALTKEGLEHAASTSSLYWGGAIFCLIADIRAFEVSRGRTGLEHAIRRVFAAGGRAWDVWDLGRVLSIADASYSAPVLQPLRARYAETPAPFDLEAVFAALGVVRKGSDIELRDDAPLAWVRRAIVRGSR